ncbi:MAG: hypothetical protein HY815_15845 [Candidatus Riflebacteria bacterium]|nr:hypothetical protein [Candidatus Riflebacteria bacterium]
MIASVPQRRDGKHMGLLWLVVLGGVLGLPAGPVMADAPGYTPPYTEVPVDRPGTLRGRVEFKGQLPPLPDLRIVSDFNACGVGVKRNESLILGPDGAVANCIVHLDKVFRGKPKSTVGVARIDQQSCVFVPHVGVALAAQPILLGNSDPVMHNIHGYTLRGWYSVFNLGFPAGSSDQSVSVRVPGPVILKCDAGHVWMRSYVYVAPNPYVAKTDASGTFSIDGIPAGTHTVRVWHEMLRELSFKVTVPASGTVDLLLEGRVEVQPVLKLISTGGTPASTAPGTVAAASPGGPAQGPAVGASSHPSDVTSTPVSAPASVVAPVPSGPGSASAGPSRPATPTTTPATPPGVPVR